MSSNSVQRISVVTAALAILLTPAVAAASVTDSELQAGPSRTGLPFEQRGDKPAKSTASGNRVPGEYIVVFKDSVDRPGHLARRQIELRRGKLGFIYRSALKGYSAKLGTGAVTALRRDPRVKAVRPNHTFVAADQQIPNGIKRVNATKNPVADIDGENDAPVDAAIAVIDTGVDQNHEDLDVVSRTDCTESSPVECVDSTGTDEHGHGTHVAGIAGAIDNGLGVVGVAPGARLWSVKVLDASGNGTEDQIVAGIDWVTEHASSIEVANMSIGCESLPCEMPTGAEAIAASVEAGVVYAVAAGNENGFAELSHIANHPDVLAVSALQDHDGEPGAEGGPDDDALAWFSNRGEAIDLVAPGVGVLSTLPEDEYGKKSGTSMASPHVAGAAALLASESNPADKEDVEAIGQQLVDEGSQNWTDRYLVEDIELTEPDWTAWTPLDGVQEPLLDLGPQAFAVYAPERALDRASTSVTLEGGINPNGDATSYRFEYGPVSVESEYPDSVPATPESVGSGMTDVKLTAAIAELDSSEDYRYRLAAINEETEEAAYSAERFFTTNPNAHTGIATGISTEGARLEGSIAPGGVSTSYYFEWGETTEYGHNTALTSAGSGTDLVSVTAKISGLEEKTNHHFRIVAIDVDEEATYGADKIFTTPAAVLNIATEEGYPVNLSSEGKGHPATAEYAGAPWYINTHDLGFPLLQCHPASDLEGISAEPGLWELQMVEDESARCDYWYIGKLWGESPFKTNGCWIVPHPGWTNDEGQFFTGTVDIGCQSGKEITVADTGPSEEPLCGFSIPPQNGLYATFVNEDDFYPQDAPDRVSVLLETTGVKHTQSSPEGSNNCTDGYFTNGQLAVWWPIVAEDANEDPVKTSVEGSSSSPIITTESATEVGINEVTTNATIHPAGFFTEYWIEYGTTTEYGETVGGGVLGEASSEFVAQRVSSELNSLLPNTVYHYRVVAHNSTGTSYGTDVTFQTADIAPVAAYSFNEGEGSTLTDSAGNHDGTIEGAEWTEAGKYGGALDFDGKPDKVIIPDAEDLDLTDSFTLEAWVRPDSESNILCVICKANGPLKSGYALSGDTGQVFNEAGDKSVTASKPTPETWRHLAFTSDGETLRLYVDGTLADSESAITAAGNSSDLSIGYVNPYGFNFYFKGLIDEVRIYDVPLSEAEIEDDRDTPVSPVAAYSFNEGEGTTLTDSVGSHDGTIEGAAWTEAGRYGGALDFDGKPDKVIIPDAEDLDLTDSFTLEAWVRPDSVSGLKPVISKAFGSEAGAYGLNASAGSGSPAGWVASGESTKVAAAESALPTEEWSHLAFTSDGETLRLYVDGSLAGSGPAVDAATNAASLRIGHLTSLGFNWYFEGLIDEVRIYDVPLSEAEIQADRDTGV